MDIKKHFFVRLLTYSEADKVTDKMDEIGGQGSITVGGISLTGTQKQFDDIISFMKKTCNRFELSQEHPEKVREDIISSLKKGGIII